MSPRVFPAMCLLPLARSPFALAAGALLVALASSTAPVAQAEDRMADRRVAGELAIERVEPAHWWTGMVHDELAVLVHGPGIGAARAALDAYPGVTLDRVTAVASPNYLFLHLTVGDEALPGTLRFRFASPAGTAEHAYELRARTRRPASYAQGFSSEDVIYLMMPDRFANGDVANDSVPGLLEGADRSNPNARHGGDLAGVRDRLGYIEDLGMTAIWFTPVFENDMAPEYGAYHGYAATDLYRIDRRFGTNAEFQDLVEACHARGIKVIMDMIHNHVGDRHWWMDDLPTPGWVHSWEENGQTSYRASASVDPYVSDADRRQLVEGWFVREMPDLDQTNPLLAQYLIQNTVWWIEESGIDGVRMDTYLYADADYMARWAEHVLEEFPDFEIVGESWMESVPHTAFWQRGAETYPVDYASTLRSVTDFPFAYAARGAFDDGGVQRLYDLLAQDLAYPDPNALVTFLDNHDLPRFLTQNRSDASALRLAYAFLMTTRGIPQVYYGTELAFADVEGQGSDGGKRADMPGGWPDDGRSAFEAAGRTPAEAAMHAYVRALTRWRRTATVVHHGRLTQFVPRDDVYVYFRWDEAPDTPDVMVVLNGARDDRQLDLGRFAERLGDDTSARDVVTGATYALMRGELAVPARTALVLELAE